MNKKVYPKIIKETLNSESKYKKLKSEYIKDFMRFMELEMHLRRKIKNMRKQIKQLEKAVRIRDCIIDELEESGFQEQYDEIYWNPDFEYYFIYNKGK
jgi:hypothetical protein